MPAPGTKPALDFGARLSVPIERPRDNGGSFVALRKLVVWEGVKPVPVRTPCPGLDGQLIPFQIGKFALLHAQIPEVLVKRLGVRIRAAGSDHGAIGVHQGAFKIIVEPVKVGRRQRHGIGRVSAYHQLFDNVRRKGRGIVDKDKAYGTRGCPVLESGAHEIVEEERAKEPHCLSTAKMGAGELHDETPAVEDLVDHELVACLTEDIAQGPGGEQGTQFVLQRCDGTLLLLRWPAFKVLPSIADALILDLPAHPPAVGLIGEHFQTPRERAATEVKIGVDGSAQEHRGLRPPELLVNAAKGRGHRFCHLKSLIRRRVFEEVPGHGAAAILGAAWREERDVVCDLPRDVAQERPGRAVARDPDNRLTIEDVLDRKRLEHRGGEHVAPHGEQVPLAILALDPAGQGIAGCVMVGAHSKPAVQRP
jgi:hypothetical protein